jgi:hypothetical protein
MALTSNHSPPFPCLQPSQPRPMSQHAPGGSGPEQMQIAQLQPTPTYGRKPRSRTDRTEIGRPTKRQTSSVFACRTACTNPTKAGRKAIVKREVHVGTSFGPPVLASVGCSKVSLAHSTLIRVCFPPMHARLMVVMAVPSLLQQYAVSRVVAATWLETVTTATLCVGNVQRRRCVSQDSGAESLARVTASQFVYCRHKLNCKTCYTTPFGWLELRTNRRALTQATRSHQALIRLDPSSCR